MGNDKPQSNEELEAVLKEKHRAEFYMELFFDFLLFQKRKQDALDEISKMVTQRKRKKWRTKKEVINGSEHKENK